MVAFVSIVLALSLLGLIVYGLHKYQTMEVKYHVDRTMPLPPIKDGERSKQPFGKRDLESSIQPARSRIRSREPGTAKSPVPGSADSQETAITKTGWQEKLAEAKNQGDFDLAYSVCSQQFPLWSAYNQACITLRSQLKTVDFSSSEAGQILEKLYNTAAMGELLHDKSEGAKSFKLHQLRNLDLPAVEKLDYPYAEIGYAQLRLVRKSDVKLMLAAWGRPESHTLPREYHAQWWQKQETSLNAS